MERPHYQYANRIRQMGTPDLDAIQAWTDQPHRLLLKSAVACLRASVPAKQLVSNAATPWFGFQVPEKNVRSPEQRSAGRALESRLKMGDHMSVTTSFDTVLLETTIDETFVCEWRVFSARRTNC